MNNVNDSLNGSDRRYKQISDPFVMDDLRQMQYAKNYNLWLYSLVKPYIGSRVLEIGSGIGNMTELLIDEVDILVGMEPNLYCADYLENRLGNMQKFKLLKSKIEDVKPVELKTYEFDTIVCMNVLEHIQEDDLILRNFEYILDKGGKIVLLVPAFPFAYGPIDASVGHFRRYTKKTMKEVVDKTNLRTDSMFYVNFIGLIGWTYNAHIKRIVKQGDMQIKFFDKLVPIISIFENLIPPPVGLSLITVLGK